jgi:site-specific DNA-adenine methylase
MYGPYEKIFTNDCLKFAELLTAYNKLPDERQEKIEKLIKIKKLPSFEPFLQEIKTEKIFGDSDEDNIEIAKKVGKKYKYSEKNIKAGRSIAIVNKYLRNGSIPYHVAYIKKIDNYGNFTTIEADASVPGKTYYEEFKYKNIEDFRNQLENSVGKNSEILILKARPNIEDIVNSESSSSSFSNKRRRV